MLHNYCDKKAFGMQVTDGKAIQKRPFPSKWMLSGNPGMLSMKSSTVPFLSPWMWYFLHLLLQIEMENDVYELGSKKDTIILKLKIVKDPNIPLMHAWSAHILQLHSTHFQLHHMVGWSKYSPCAKEVDPSPLHSAGKSTRACLFVCFDDIWTLQILFSSWIHGCSNACP